MPKKKKKILTNDISIGDLRSLKFFVESSFAMN